MVKTKNPDRSKIKSEVINFNLSPAEKKEAEQGAELLGVTLSCFLRLAIKAYLKNIENL